MVDILAFGAHPDDIEFGAGGILLAQKKLGHTIALCDLCLGQKGSNGTPEERRSESLKAAKILGAERTFLDFVDCEIFDSTRGREKLVEVIRHYQPKLILAPLWEGTQNHPDHLALGSMARYATRLSRFSKFLGSVPSHRPEGILHYTYPFHRHPDFIVDVTEVQPAWLELIRCHASQLQTRPYDRVNMNAASYLGSLIGVEYAQGLVKGNPLQVDNLMHISKSSLEV